MHRVLLTTPYGPYELKSGENYYDLLGSRLQRGQGPFTLSSEMPALALYLIAENLNARTTVLEYPHLDDYVEELKNDYDYVGFQVMHFTLRKIAHMMRIAKEVAPRSKLIVGGYGVLGIEDPPPGETEGNAEFILQNADYLCTGEGVGFLRRLLGDEPADRPISQRYLPHNTTYLPGAEGHSLASSVMNATALVALGCPNGCEFCATSAMFKKEKIYVATPEETFQTLKHYCRRNGGQPTTVALMDENLLLNRDYVLELGRRIREDEEFGLRKLNYFCFGYLRSIANYTMEELLECGVDTIWAGVESTIDDVVTSTHRIEKRTCADIRSTFRALAGHGIGVTASMAIGWDFHTGENIQQDVDFFVDLEPTQYQITFLTACPGTELYRRMKESDRLLPSLTYDDLQLYNARTFVPKNFTCDELREHFHLAHQKLYCKSGPTMLRTFQLNLNGYETCRRSSRPLLCEQKASLFAERARKTYPILAACAEFAPSDVVREKVRESDERYRRLFGEPTESQKFVAEVFCGIIAQRADDLKRPKSEAPYDPIVRRTYYDPHRGDVPLVQVGRDGQEPVPMQLYARRYNTRRQSQGRTASQPVATR